MAKRIVIASGKGGVGKSTTAAFLGMRLAARGKKTLLIDCDAGLGSLDLLLPPAADTAYHWMDAVNGACTPTDATIPLYSGLFLLRAPAVRPEDAPETCLKELAETLDGDYDFILLDAPAGLGSGLKRAALAADTALIIATPDEVSVQGAGKADALLREYGVTETRLIINRYDAKTAKKGRQLAIDSAIDKTCVQLIGVVPEDPVLKTVSVTRKFKVTAKGIQAFDRIARRLQGENVLLTLSLLK